MSEIKKTTGNKSFIVGSGSSGGTTAAREIYIQCIGRNELASGHMGCISMSQTVTSGSLIDAYATTTTPSGISSAYLYENGVQSLTSDGSGGFYPTKVLMVLDNRSMFQLCMVDGEWGRAYGQVSLGDISGSPQMAYTIRSV